MSTPTAPPAAPPGEPATAPAPTQPETPTQPTPPAETVTVKEPVTPAGQDSATARFTAEQLETARRQEKDKLYKRLENSADERKALLEELAQLRKEREDRAAAEAKQQAAAEDAAKAKREGDMSAKALLEQRTQEWETRFAEIQADREREALAKESEFNRLRAYTQERLAAERNNIAPELIDLVTGNSQEEIDASIGVLKNKTLAILESVQQAQTANRAQMRGVSTAGYTMQGPTDNDSGFRQLSADDIKNMSMSEYAKYREQLLGAASDSYRGRGLFK
jgi:hypothetical protein